MRRIPRLTRRYIRNAQRLSIVPGSARGKAVGGVIAALGTEEELPGSEDIRALIPPTGDAFVRRVPGRNLWLWYVLPGDDAVTIIAVTADPPVPVV